MLKLEDIKKDAQIRGIQADEIVRVVQVEAVGDNALTVYYKDNQGRHHFEARKRMQSGFLAGIHPISVSVNATVTC